jgi:predicted Zn-dependent protease
MALLAAACATTGRQAMVTSVRPPVYAAIPGLTPAQRVEQAIARLRQGQRDEARAELKAALAQSPGDKVAQKLLASIDSDAKATLGAKSYSYTVKPGETLWSISQRLLGDPLLFYSLARYNQIDIPESVNGGQVLLIPGSPPRRVAAPAPRKPAARPATPAPVQARAADPVQAGQLRRAALEHMNRGRIDKAEALLQQARVLDPDNPTIQADLDRARRIQASVRPRS